jgi:hypothetical protein
MARRKKKEHDFAVTAFRVAQEAVGEDEAESKPDIDYSALGRKGGRKGGKARASKLTPEQRSEIARVAASARWRKKD